eukprot:6186017-Pleurochrysis_carterae.AAC.3
MSHEKACSSCGRARRGSEVKWAGERGVARARAQTTGQRQVCQQTTKGKQRKAVPFRRFCQQATEKKTINEKSRAISQVCQQTTENAKYEKSSASAQFSQTNHGERANNGESSASMQRLLRNKECAKAP